MVRGRRSRRAADFESLYREGYSTVYNYVYYRCLDQALTEDVVSDAFIKAAKAFDRFDAAKASFSTWVIAIARNCLNDHYRRNRAMFALDDVNEAVFAVEEEYPDLEEDRGALAKQLLETLSEEERELVFLKYFKDKRNTEIADELGMNASTVATKLMRAMQKMRAAAGDVDIEF